MLDDEGARVERFVVLVRAEPLMAETNDLKENEVKNENTRHGITATLTARQWNQQKAMTAKAVHAKAHLASEAA